MIDWKRTKDVLPPLHHSVLVYLPEAYAPGRTGMFGNRLYVGIGELSVFGWHVTWEQTGTETFSMDAVTHWADITVPE